MFIGIDYGMKRIGIAIGDEENRVAFPLQVVAPKEALARVGALVKERGAEGVVIGESKNFAGEDNFVMADIRRFAQEVGEAAGVAVFFEPEFLTSAQAEREGETTKENLDASAAALILQSFLDRRHALQ